MSAGGCCRVDEMGVHYVAMKRSTNLNVLSRREVFAIAGCVGLAVVGCTDGTGGVQTGGLGSTGNGGPDANGNGPDGSTPIDAHQPSDASSAATCTGTATDVGAPSSFTTGVPVYVSSGKFFVVRDANGLYAVTAVCTHQGATCQISGQEYFCPRHGAEFQFDGTIIGGPVSRELAHYAMCTLSNGHVGVTKTTCAKTQRLDV